LFLGLSRLRFINLGVVTMGGGSPTMEVRGYNVLYSARFHHLWTELCLLDVQVARILLWGDVFLLLHHVNSRLARLLSWFNWANVSSLY
jgi:hypothetical protein